ncbi:unnamed protein product, partial [Ilex paraguariensis]
AGEDGKFTLQPCSYTAHGNISQNYLQELFGSFPFHGPGSNELQDAETSDEDYQIYEHYSDDNYTDDNE